VKRAPELRDLSDDHHHGLVLARKAKQASNSEDELLVSTVWKEVEKKFIKNLEPHFQIEETLIAPNLAVKGSVKLLSRFYEDHKKLRKFIKPGSKRTANALQSFGELLEKHIRFEERELFEVAQKFLSQETLISIATACKATHNKD
jgi:hemerythrin-like domain-containing protein